MNASLSELVSRTIPPPLVQFPTAFSSANALDTHSANIKLIVMVTNRVTLIPPISRVVL